MPDPIELLSGETLATVQLAATAAMTGLIWFVQIVHYPLFAAVGRDGFPAYARMHQNLTGLVVAPIMAVEMATASLQVVAEWSTGLAPTIVAAYSLLWLVWASTAFVQMPCHHRLSGGFDAAVHRRLVWSNWFRTAAWTLRLALLIVHSTRPGLVT